MKAILYHRDFSTEILPPRVDYVVSDLSWAAIGGPDKASIEASGRDAWEMIERLRYPVVILNERNVKVWWGFVNSVTVYDGQIQTSVSLDDVVNRIIVSFSEISDTDKVGEKKLTDWAEDEISRFEYGAKEKFVYLGQGTTAQANNLRDTLLDRWKFPIPGTSVSGRSELRASIKCLGWWHTLDWKYYEDSVGGTEETTTQLETIIGSGEFITAVDKEVSSGITSDAYREGDKVALAEALDLLNSGTSNLLRILVEVDEYRRARIYEEPVPGYRDMFISKNTEFFDYLGKTIPRSEVRPGMWLRLKDVVPASTDTSKLADMSRFFVEEVVYYPKTKQINVRQRDQSKLLKFGGI